MTPRDFSEPWRREDEFPDMVDRIVSEDAIAASKARRERILAEAAEREKADKLRADEARAKATARTLEHNRRQLLAEYQTAGVAPPNVDESGRPTASLSMLLRLGWKIEQIGGYNVLVKP